MNEVAHYEEPEKKAVIMEKAEHKLGPTDIGRLTGYDVAEYDIKRESGIFKDRNCVDWRLLMIIFSEGLFNNYVKCFFR